MTPKKQPLPMHIMEEALKHYANKDNWEFLDSDGDYTQWIFSWGRQEPWDIAKKALDDEDHH